LYLETLDWYFNRSIASGMVIALPCSFALKRKTRPHERPGFDRPAKTILLRRTFSAP
jgi:hypothetical protein